MFIADHFYDIQYLRYGRDFGGCDCYGLVRLILSQALGVKIPSYVDDYSHDDREGIGDLINAEAVNFEAVTAPQSGDIIHLYVKGQPAHVGLMLDQKRYIHTLPRIGEHVSPLSKYKVMGIYRCTQ